MEVCRFTLQEESLIINIVVSDDSSVLALMTENHRIYIYENVKALRTFHIINMIDLSTDDEFVGLSKCLVFDKSSNKSIYFLDQCQIYKLNYVDHSMEDVF